MAVPSSGELRLYADIGVELGVPQSDVSLGAMSNSAGFSEPDSMSDFYGYVDAIAPSVTTNAISNVGETTLRANGNVTSDGGGTITERGFYVGTNSVAPTNNAKYTVTGTTGSYLLNVTGLNDNTTFYVWAFATNLIGTTYGSRVQATTVQSFTPTYARGGDQIYVGVTDLSRSDFIYAEVSKYYVNPYTGGLVNYAFQDLSANNVTSYTFDFRGFAQSNYCTNATNLSQLYVDPHAPTVTALASINLRQYGSNGFSNQQYVAANYGSIGINFSFAQTYITTGYEQIPGFSGSYLQLYFDYGT